MLQGAYFRDVLAVHGETTTDERDYRRRARISEPLAAEAKPLREKHNAVLLENAGLQQRLQEVGQEAEALRTENATLQASILVSLYSFMFPFCVPTFLVSEGLSCGCPSCLSRPH